MPHTHLHVTCYTVADVRKALEDVPGDASIEFIGYHEDQDTEYTSKCLIVTTGMSEERKVGFMCDLV